MDCPRCQQPDVADDTCPRCGVIVTKAREALDRRRWGRDPAPPVPPGASPTWPYWLLAVVLLTVGVGAWLRPRVRAALPPPEAVAVRAPVGPTTPLPQPSAIAVPEAAPIAPPPEGGGITAADLKAYDTLAGRIKDHVPMGDADVETAASLHEHYPKDPLVQRLLMEVLLLAAGHHNDEHHPVQAQALLRRAMALSPADPRPHIILINIMTAAADWRGVETAAQDLIAIDARQAGAWYALGHALFRQDRTREAVSALKTCLDLGDHVPARSLLGRMQKNLADERGMTEQHISHFHVRYDGEAHEDIGREILAALERDYATLTSALDYEPRDPVPVILFSHDQYFVASGAPAWSGGNYDGLDGRIRIPIGGVVRGLSPQIDNTLMHELTHAFVNEKSGGHAPRELHEGLAQYMAGDRVADQLTGPQLTLLANGRVPGVAGFYLGALSFAEYLMAQRGRGGINDLLRGMADTGSVDEAFRQTYGQDLTSTRRAWQQRLQQEYGSS